MRTLTEEVAQHREEIRALRALVDDLARALRSGGTSGSAGGATTVTPVHAHQGGGSGGPIGGARVNGALRFDEIAAPGTPPAGSVYLYAKSDGRLYSKDDAGAESGPL